MKLRMVLGDIHRDAAHYRAPPWSAARLIQVEWSGVAAGRRRHKFRIRPSKGPPALAGPRGRDPARTATSSIIRR